MCDPQRKMSVRVAEKCITPHVGEMAQLLERNRDDIEADPLAPAREAADLLQAVMVMKGAETHVVTWESEHSSFPESFEQCRITMSRAVCQGSRA